MLSVHILAADITFQASLVEQLDSGIVKHRDKTATFFVRGNLLRIEEEMDVDVKATFLDPKTSLVPPTGVQIFDASKGTAIIFLPEEHIYSTVDWDGFASPVPLSRKKLGVTETGEIKTLGQWKAKLRRVKVDGCDSENEAWVTTDPEVLRDLVGFVQIAEKRRTVPPTSSKVPVGADHSDDPDLGFILEQHLSCTKNSPDKGLRGYQRSMKVDYVHFDTLDPSLFMIPPGFREVSHDELNKIVRKKTKNEGKPKH